MQTIIRSNLARLATLAILVTSLTACGGGGGSDGATQNATAGTSSSAGQVSTGATGSTGSTNHAPTISGSAAPTVTAGQPYNFVPSANDSDADSLQFSISSKPSWAAFDTATGRLSGTPTSASVGSYEEIEITVSDGKTTAKLAAFAITVEAAAPTNENVTVSWQPPTTNSDGSTLTDLNGYRILYGTKSGVYTQSVTVNGAGLTSYMLENLLTGSNYYVTMVAVNSAGAESEKTQEIVIDLT